MASHRVAFILYGYPLGISSMVVNSIKMFAREGHNVDIIIDEETYVTSPTTFYDANIRLVKYVFEKGLLIRLFQFFFDKLYIVIKPVNTIAKYLSIRSAVFCLDPRLFSFSQWLIDFLSLHKYDLVIAVDYRSLISIHGVCGTCKTIYYDMELMDWQDNKHLYINKIYWKNLEYRIIQAVDHVTIQSDYRAKLFAEINNCSINKIHILPVASMGDAIKDKSDFFRKKFSIPKEQKIVIYSGNFRDWAYCIEIIQSVKDWPSDCSLVMHTWKSSNVNTSYFHQMKDAAQGMRVYFSSEYIEPDLLAHALSSADIGLMFYRPIDGNFTEIMYSSNKLGEYLKSGLPVICSDYATLREFVIKQKIGLPLSSFDDLPNTIKTISNLLDEYRENALICYMNRLRFESFFEIFYKNIISNDL